MVISGLANCVSQIYYFHICLFEYRLLKRCVWECVEQGKIDIIEDCDIQFITGIGGTVARDFRCAGLAIQSNTHNFRCYLAILRHEDLINIPVPPMEALTEFVFFLIQMPR